MKSIKEYNTQEGSLYALGLAYCIQITPDFSFGVTLNYWDDSFSQDKWESRYHEKGNRVSPTGIPYSYYTDKKESFTFNGWNANLGFLWTIDEHWTLGGVFKTPFSADIERTITRESAMIVPTEPDIGSPRITTLKYDETLNMPMAYGIGIAYRFSDVFTLSGDIYRTHWNDFEFEDEQGEKTSAVSGKDAKDSNVDPTTWFRLGGEYLIIGQKIVSPLRVGIFYDPAPAEGSPDDYYGFSLGTGLVYKQFVFDVAYQFRFGNNVGEGVLKEMGFSQDVQEHMVYASLIIHF